MFSFYILTVNTCIRTSKTIKSTIQTNVFIIIPFSRSFGTITYNENIVGIVPDILIGGLIMEDSRVVSLFEWMDTTTEKIENLTEQSYLESMVITLEALFYGESHNELLPAVKKEIETFIQLDDPENYTVEEMRKAIQLMILKGMKQHTQHQHVMTPETISLFIGYLAEKLTSNLEEVRLFDPAVGVGNLLLIVMDHLKHSTEAYASEVDATLLKLSLLNANLQKKQVEYFHQDSLRPLLLDPVDLVVADLPVGYYPDDIQAEEYELKASKGHSYAHHLFIEQSLTYTKPGGYLIFIIPEALFESEYADDLHRFIQKHAHITGLIQLPETAFASKKHKKSIFILQKKGEHTEDLKEPLLAMLPSFNNTAGMEDILAQINQWFADNDIHL